MQTLRSGTASQVVYSRGRRGGLTCRAALESDASARVKGRLGDVFSYVVNPANFPAYCPAIHESRIVKGYGPDVRSRWEISQTVGPVKNVAVTYEIVDLVPDRRVIYALNSELYTGTEQRLFMQDPNDSTGTVVRCISSIELNLWKKAMQPFLSSSFRAAPEQNMGGLTSLLSSSKSPIQGSWGTNQGSRNPFSGLFSGQKASSKRSTESKIRTGTTSVKSSKYATKVEVDSLGYYAALGLDWRRYRKLRPEEIKAAFRSAAMTKHPDKFSMDAELMADEERRTVMEEDYKKIARAYEVLKDPEQKKLYDEGRLREEQQEA